MAMVNSVKRAISITGPVLILVLAIAVCIRPAGAQTGRIAAVVNNDAITVSDVAQRMRMIMQSAGMPNNEKVRKRLRERVLDSLIEEQVKLQKAREIGIEISNAQLEKGLKTIAQRNDVPLAEFKAMFRQQGVPLATLRRQVRAQLAWSQVVKRELRSQVNISRKDIEARREQLRQTIGEPQYRIAEIFLASDDDSNAGKTSALARKLVKRLKQGDASFPRLARQFSQSAGASQGGDLGWMRAEQLPGALRAVI